MRTDEFYDDEDRYIEDIPLELKYNEDADSAISQILRQQYPAKVAEYGGELLLVGINYDKRKKTHQCKIMRMKK